MHKITIPTPCHQNWDEMLPNNEGRHCLSCAKTVVDFTSMSNDEVQNYFINKQHQSVCGRFKTTQLNTIEIQLPQNIFSLTMPLWKKVLAACLLAFGMMLFSCNSNTTGKALLESTGVIVIDATTKDSTALKLDTIALPKPPKNIENIKGEVQIVESYIVGDIAITPMPEPPPITMGVPAIIEDPKIDSVKVNDTARCNKNIFL